MKSSLTRALVLLLSLATPACHLIFGVGDPTLTSGTGAGGNGGGNDDGGGGSGAGGSPSGSGGSPVVDPCEGVTCVTDNPCETRTCNEFGDCVPEFKTGDLEEQTAGDCMVRTCANGVLFIFPLDDAPPSPPGVCYEFDCDDGVPEDAPLADGTPCGDLGGSCESGLCSICDDPTDCGVDTECLFFDCAAGECLATPAGQGTVVSNQVPGDCLSFVCMGETLPVTIPFVEDLPNDENDCTEDLCTEDGASTFEPRPQGDDCSQGYCDGAGHCVECVFDENCVADPQGALCNQETFSCGCKGAADCAMNSLGNSCILPAGVCGCSSDQNCKSPAPYCNGTTRQCQATKPGMVVIVDPPMDDP